VIRKGEFMTKVLLLREVVSSAKKDEYQKGVDYAA